MTGHEVNRPLSENDFSKSMSPYAVFKLTAFWLDRVYREAYGLYVVNGILFNTITSHYSKPRKGLEFITCKISNETAKIALGLSKELRFGNIHAKHGWGYAPEYVYGMWLMLQKG